MHHAFFCREFNFSLVIKILLLWARSYLGSGRQKNSIRKRRKSMPLIRLSFSHTIFFCSPEPNRNINALYRKTGYLFPFIYNWIIIFNSVTEVFRPVKTITSFLSILISRLTNISYKDMLNLSSPSDCIQFFIRNNKRMIISCIIHIIVWRNSTVNWSWGVET